MIRSQGQFKRSGREFKEMLIVENFYQANKSYCFSSAICLESVCSIIEEALRPDLNGWMFSLDNSQSPILPKISSRTFTEEFMPLWSLF